MAEHGDGAIIIDTKLDNSGFAKGSAEMKKAMDSLTDTAKELTATVTDAVREMGKATSGAAAETEKASATSTRTLSEVRAELEKTRRKWDELFARQEKALALGDNTDSRGFRALDYDIEQVGERIRVLEEEERQLAAAEAEANAQRVAGIGSLADSAAAALRYSDALSEIEQATVRETRGMRVWSALKGIVTGALNGIRGGAVRAAQGFATLGNSSQKAQKKLNVKRILMYSLGIRSMYSLVRKAKQYFQEGFGNLAKYSAPVKSAMASINGALGTLKGSLATAFSPIYTAAAPALTYLINLLAQAANYVGQLFSALTGQTTYMKAVSSGVSDIGSAAGSAAGSAKKLKRELAGFDQLEILSDNSGGGGGGGGAGGALGAMFEESPISQAIVGFSDAIKTALEDQFSQIGLIIAGGAAVIGAILTFGGFNVPLGIAMMVSGLSAGFAIIAANWSEMPDELRKVVTIIETILGGAMLAIGAILTFSGTHIALGIALMAAGAVTLASAVAVNWNIITEKLKGPISAIVTLVSGALLALGILAIVGGHIPLGIGLLVAGAAGMAATVSANWNIIKEKLQGPLGTAVALISGAALVLGILALMAGMVPLGLGLILAGAGGLATTIAANWNNLVNLGKTAIQKVKEGWDWLKDKAFEIAVFIGTKIADLWDWTKTQWNNLKQRTVSFAATVANNAAQWWNNVKGWWADNIRGKSLAEVVTNVANSAGRWWANVQEWWHNTTVGKALDSVITNVKNQAGVWWNRVKSWWHGTTVGKALDSVITNVKNNASTWWTRVKNWWDEAKKAGGDKGMVSTFLTGVMNSASAWWDNVKNWWNAAKRGDKGYVAKFLTSVVDSSGIWWKNVQDWWHSTTAGKMVDKFLTSVKDNSGTWWTRVKNWWKGAMGKDTVSDFIANIKDNSSQWWSNVQKWWNEASGTVGIFATITNTAKNLWDQISSLWNGDKRTLQADVKLNFDDSGYQYPEYYSGRRGGRAASKARGGIIPDGMRGMVRNIPQYARGTLAAHGTMFVAGENGPEIMGHINGKTEILNRSQIAAAMYAATTRALHNVQYRAPAMASGSVLPYAVAAQYARETERLQSTIEASNEDMAQAVIGAISSAALAIVGAVQKYGGGDGGFGGLNAQNVIDEINRRTNMFNRSPLKG